MGLDISDLSLKAVQIQKKARINTIRALNWQAVPAGLIEEGVIKDEDKIAKLIRRVIEKSTDKFTTQYAAISLPEPKTFIKLIDIASKKIEGHKIRDLIRKELPRHIPIDINEMQIDWQEVNNGHKYRKFLVAAVPKTIVEEYVKVCNMAGIEVVALEVEAQAIERAILPRVKNKDSEGVKIILDLGASRTSIILLDRGMIQFANSIANLSGEKITEKIMEKKNLSHDKAEKAKLICGSSPKKCKGVILEIINEAIDELVKEIINAINFYQDHFAGQTKDLQIILCGGGANMNNIDKTLEEKLKRKIVIADPLANISSELPKKVGNIEAYTTAIGLALRNII